MASSLPAVLAAVEALVPTLSGMTTVQVVSGEIGTFIAAEQFTVADTTGSDTLGPLTGGHPELFNESYDITGQMRTFTGGDDIKARRTRVLAMKDALRDGLAADMSVGGLVTRAYLSSYTLRAGFDGSGEGVAAECDLTIHVDNFEG